MRATSLTFACLVFASHGVHHGRTVGTAGGLIQASEARIQTPSSGATNPLKMLALAFSSLNPSSSFAFPGAITTPNTRHPALKLNAANRGEVVQGTSGRGTFSAQISRRHTINAVAAITAAFAPLAALALPREEDAAKQIRSKVDELKAFLEKEEAFTQGLVTGDASAPQLPKSVEYVMFQALEDKSDPQFMEAAADYLEAMRGARDYVKLAKMLKTKVKVSTKEEGKPDTVVEMDLVDAPGTGMATAPEYAAQAFQEVLGAKVVLSAIVEFMPEKYRSR